MSAVYQFRLTGILYHQIRRSGKTLAAILANWDDGDYELLCDYVRDCKSIVPKYIRQIADLLDVSPRKIVKDILACRRGCSFMNGDDEERDDYMDSYSFGEDSVDLTLFIQKYCHEVKQYM